MTCQAWGGDSSGKTELPFIYELFCEFAACRKDACLDAKSNQGPGSLSCATYGWAQTV